MYLVPEALEDDVYVVDAVNIQRPEMSVAYTRIFVMVPDLDVLGSSEESTRDRIPCNGQGFPPRRNKLTSFEPEARQAMEQLELSGPFFGVLPRPPSFAIRCILELIQQT